MNYEDREYHITRKRPKDGVSFGIIPNTVINRAIDRTNRFEILTVLSFLTVLKAFHKLCL